jgi:hypothetical protein
VALVLFPAERIEVDDHYALVASGEPPEVKRRIDTRSGQSSHDRRRQDVEACPAVSWKPPIDVFSERTARLGNDNQR